MSTTSRPALRWAVPAGVTALVLSGAVLGPALSASAEVELPERTPEQLLTDLQTADVDAFSGTVAHHADLGLPSLPSGMGGGEHSTDAASLLDGSHDLRVWAAGNSARVSLHGEMGELTVVTDGEDLWTWSSDEQTATHADLPAHDPAAAAAAAEARAAMPTATPEAVTDAVLQALDPTTTVTSGPNVTVAGRPAYVLVLEPAEPGSLVGSVRVAVDAGELVPTRVQVFPAGSSTPALDVGFTSLSFETPDADLFSFTPPPGATVEERTSDGHGMLPGDLPSGLAGNADVPGDVWSYAARVGTGWSTVLVGRVPAGALAAAEGDAAAFLGALPRVSGDWGSGRLLTSRLFSALVTDDGRVLVGAVDGDTLTAAAADPAADLG
ncbi:hypothetical protein [uncultured Cellulomonas sp.]|uniref:LolA family protein n=1 Tax=uncultured Cellulomonas sp. TaxID=189682 RepID=UPI00261E6686|nr:hypothetical protein [uncultured Cellulomonas sp.]